MAGSATITGTQNYVLGIGHPKTEAATEAPPAVFATDPLTGGVVGLVGPDGVAIPIGVRTRRGSPRFYDYSTGAYTLQSGTVDAAYAGADALSGGQNYRLTTASTVASTAGFRRRWAGANGPSTDGNGGFVVPVKVLASGPVGGTSAEIKLTISNTVSAGTANATAIQYLQSGLLGWQYLYFPLDKFVANGAPTQVPNATATYDFQVEVKTQTANTADAIVGPIYFSAGMRPAISIECDDGFLSQYTELFPLMQERGLRGTMAVIAARVGTTGYVTESMLNEMYAAGWDFAVHGDTVHSSFGTRGALKDDVTANQAYIAARWPRAARHYTYIGGSVNQPWSEDVLTELGFLSSRLVNRSSPMGLAMQNPRECWLRMPSNPIFDASIAARITDVDDAISGKWVSTAIHFHSVQGVSPETATENTTRANAVLLLDKIRDAQAAGKIDVLTRTEMYTAYFR